MKVMFVGAMVALSGCANQVAKPDLVTARDQVETTERAFAKSMADRDVAVLP
jgi:hypothetical protein